MTNNNNNNNNNNYNVTNLFNLSNDDGIVPTIKSFVSSL